MWTNVRPTVCGSSAEGIRPNEAACEAVVPARTCRHREVFRREARQAARRSVEVGVARGIPRCSPGEACAIIKERRHRRAVEAQERPCPMPGTRCLPCLSSRDEEFYKSTTCHRSQKSRMSARQE